MVSFLASLSLYMHHSSFQQNPPHNACKTFYYSFSTGILYTDNWTIAFVSATPIPEQYPPTMVNMSPVKTALVTNVSHLFQPKGAHSMRPPPPLDMSQVYHSNNDRASISSHYSNSNLHDSHRSRRISVVTSSDWKVSSRRPASRMEKTCSESFIEQQQSSRASIIEPRTPAYTPYTPNHHHSNSYFPSQQQQQQQMVASPQDYRTMMTSPLPTPGTDQHKQSFVGGFVIPPPIVQQPCYPPQVLPSSQQHPPSLHQRRQSSFVEALPPPSSSSASSASASYPYRRSMPPPPIAKMSLGPSGAQTQTLPSKGIVLHIVHFYSDLLTLLQVVLHLT